VPTKSTKLLTSLISRVLRTAPAAALFGYVVALSGSARGLAADESATEFFGGQQFDIPDPRQGGRGGQIYLSTCARCHDKGVERAPQRTLFVYMSPQSVYRALKDGEMRAEAEGLSDNDKTLVAEFVTRRQMSAAAETREPPTCEGTTARFNFGEPPILSGYGLAGGNTRFIPSNVSGLNKTNVGRLRLKWAVAFPNSFQMRSEPTLAAGAIYVGSHNGGVYALDRTSGCARWIFQAGSEVRTGIVVSQWRVDDHAAQPRVYFGDIDGNVYALDARSGRLIWRARADENPSTITGTPTLYGNILYVPVSSFEATLPANPRYECCKFRGSVVAYNAADGSIKWKTYTTDPPRLVGKNAKGANQYAPSGAPVWNSPTIDTKRKVLYVGTGENYSSPANRTSDAVIAMDLDSGAIKWVFQALAGDAMNLACMSEDRTNCPKENGPDFDIGGAGTMLVTIANGHERVIAGQKSGDVYALNPENGTLIWRAKPGRGGMMGGVEFGLAANNEFVFAAINDAPDGREYVGTPRPGIYALALSNGAQAWSAPANDAGCSALNHCTPGYWQAITATPSLVFAGTENGWLRIFDAHSGVLLWEFDANKSVKTVTGEEKTGGSFGGGAGPIVYQGMLFASSGYTLAGLSPGNLLLAFELAKSVQPPRLNNATGRNGNDTEVH